MASKTKSNIPAVKKRTKVSGSKPKPTRQRIMVLQANGKIHFDWRPIS